MPREGRLFLSFKNSCLVIKVIGCGMPWQANALPTCQGGSDWQSLAVVRRGTIGQAKPCSFNRLYNVRSLMPMCLASSLRVPLNVASACASELPSKGIEAAGG